MLTLALKDLRVIGRDWFGVFWIFVFPLLYACFFGAIFSGQSGARGAMPVALVDESKNAQSRAFLERLADSAAVKVARDNNGAIVLDAAAAARDKVRRGDCVAYVRVKPGFAGAFQMFSGQAEDRILEVGIDPSRQAEAGYLQGVLMQSMFRGFTDRFQDKDEMKRQITKWIAGVGEADDLNLVQKAILKKFLGSLDTFIADADFGAMGGEAPDFGASMVETVSVSGEVRGKPRSAFDVMFPSAILWGLIGCMAGFAISVVRERTEGTLLRLQVAPVSRAHVLGGKALACFLMCAAVAVFLLMIGRFALGVNLGSLPLLAVAVACTGICFTGIMMTVAVMGKTEQAVAGAGWGVMMPMAMVGGAMVPLIAMPGWMRTLSNVSPVKWGIYAIEGAVWRDFSAAEMLVPCVILVVIGAVCFSLGVWIFSRQRA